MPHTNVMVSVNLWNEYTGNPTLDQEAFEILAGRASMEIMEISQGKRDVDACITQHQHLLVPAAVRWAYHLSADDEMAEQMPDEWASRWYDMLLAELTLRHLGEYKAAWEIGESRRSAPKIYWADPQGVINMAKNILLEFKENTDRDFQLHGLGVGCDWDDESAFIPLVFISDLAEGAGPPKRWW